MHVIPYELYAHFVTGTYHNVTSRHTGSKNSVGHNAPVTYRGMRGARLAPYANRVAQTSDFALRNRRKRSSPEFPNGGSKGRGNGQSGSSTRI